MAVKRCYVGAFVTSMEMAGVSLTVMVLNEDRLKYLGNVSVLFPAFFYTLFTLNIFYAFSFIRHTFSTKMNSCLDLQSVFSHRHVLSLCLINEN